ncbi:MAG: DUF5696 domain-containing protein [Caldilineales bacterium]|nr:DUF5696 domain-containing protein [Caldilineales bacterium]MDW8319238.1 DUF5696 domain-containing protein [Anaerolineae bacterium]
MARRRWLWRLVMIVALLLGGLAPGSAAQTAGQPAEIPAAYRPAAENERFQLYVDFDTLAFKLVDRRSGYVWHSGVDELQPGDRLNRAWQAFARSGVSIEHLDRKAVPKRLSLANANRTLTVTPAADGVDADLAFDDVGIRLRLSLRLEEDGVRVEVPFASIREENPDFRLGVLYLYPFLGATRGGSVPGYMLLPDGTGSLVRFADATKARNMFYGRYYGPDLGMAAVLPFDPQVNRPLPLSAPVYGLVHGEGQHAMLSVVERGAAYAELQVHPAGIITNFNFIHHAFIYNQSYFQATNRAGAGVTTVQAQPNAFDVVVHYRFLTGADADYVGLARSYQRYLVERGMLRRRDVGRSDAIGVRLEFLGGDKEKVLLWSRFVPMTTVAQMRDILADLAIPRAEAVYYGWQPSGASSMPPRRLRLEPALGDLDDLRRLAQEVQAGGGQLSLYLDPQAALVDEPGYSPRNDLAMAITNVNLRGFNRNHPNYYLSFRPLQALYTPLAESVAEAGLGLALDGVSNVVYSDFRKSAPMNREQAIQARRELLAQVDLPLAFYRPNDYLFDLMRAYFDMPLGDNGYIYTHEAVPFLPVVLAGYVPYYGTALNFSPNLQEDLLRHADFGIYPSFFVTYEGTAAMLNTASNWIFTSAYAQWKEPIQQAYRWLNGVLGPVVGQEIVGRRQLADGVFATAYANGLEVVVNYTDRPFAAGGLTVPPKDAALRRAVP